ncbi:MAG: chaperone modulator CbpM [Syntrophomonas sp.]|nr:chaperone modulator CbpM [Syntrophomonas sp.]
MEIRRHYMVLCRPRFQSGLLSLAELARETCVHPEFLERMVDLGLIEPVQYSPVMLFAPEAAADVGRALRLRNDLGINWAGVGVVMDLLERIAQLEYELARLRNS